LIAKKGIGPDLDILCRYLKLAIAYCVEHDLMYVPLYSVKDLDPPLPFSIESLPDVVSQIEAMYDSDDEQTEVDSQPTLFDDLDP